MTVTTRRPRKPQKIRRAAATKPERMTHAPSDEPQPSPAPGEVIESFIDPQLTSPAVAKEESLETDVAPDRIDRQAPTSEELH